MRITDFVVIVVAVVLGQLLRFGSLGVESDGGLTVSVTAVWMAIIALWYAVLRITQCQDWRVIGCGGAEYSRILQASFYVFGGLAVADLLIDISIARGYLAVVFPLGTIGLLGSRKLWRLWIEHGRRAGANVRQVLVLGDARSARPLIERLDAHPSLGYRVVAICTPDDDSSAPAESVRVGDRVVEVTGTFSDVRRAVESSGATTVAVTSADSLGHSAMRELSWELDGLDVEMMIAPALLDVAGPRLSVRPQAGLPLLFVDRPTYKGATRFLKLTFDKVLCALALLILLPVFAACAIAIKLDSDGPVFYRAERIGLDNRPFRMWKFRSMVAGADAMRSDLATFSDGNTVLFKMHDDPRVTRVGMMLRRYSLDELPQLLNVLGGSMSLVGPRPPLGEEVQTYDSVVIRRMLVRPGMTGLWQVSGRSDLSWEQSVHLDLSYVENWSLAGDVVLLWRTVRAVLATQGAY